MPLKIASHRLPDLIIMPIAQHIQHIQQLIHETACKHSRNPESVRLIAISKGQPASAIKDAFSAGIADFGENYWQEAQGKLASLRDLPLTWHFTGPIQSNKSQEIAENFTWVHSLDREKIARLLSKHRPDHLPPLNVCIQINLDEEPGKAGIPADELSSFAAMVKQLPGLELRGLMAIPLWHKEEELQYKSLRRLTALLHEANQQLNLHMDTLSMGMSDDLIPAIAAGSTMVRIGRAIFGERKERQL